MVSVRFTNVHDVLVEIPPDKRAAEQGPVSRTTLEEHPSGAKARIISWAFSARLKSCPDTERIDETRSTTSKLGFGSASPRLHPGSQYAAAYRKQDKEKTTPHQTRSLKAGVPFR